MEVNAIGIIPLASFPFPYKYLIGLGFYFFIKYQVDAKEKVITKAEYLLFLPAIIYGLLRTYWYVQLHFGYDEDIFWNVYKTGFFVFNEFVYLFFNLGIMVYAIRFQKKVRSLIKGSVSKMKNWDWLLTFSWTFTGMIILNLLHQTMAVLFNLEHSGQFYYLILLLNSIYIYWIGFVGYTKSNLLFKTYTLKDQTAEQVSTHPIKERLIYFMEEQEVFTNQNLKVSDLAVLLNLNEKELSLFIHENFGQSFTDFINHYRVEKVKYLLCLPEQEKYTLLALAEKAGFRSKSSFNAVFKKIAGMTPTQYKKINR